MKQQCYLASIYGSWLILIAGAAYMLIRGSVVEAIVWVIFVGFFLSLYVRYFPSLSRFLGYGSVADTPAGETAPARVRVTLYTGAGCPFCPVVRRRLLDLREKMGFGLDVIDVTLKPGLLIAKGIRALPVIEIGEARWVGNATSEELARFITASAPGAGSQRFAPLAST